MSVQICYIIGAGDNYGLDFVPQAGDFVIAADGGADYLNKQGMNADLYIGDFDSVREKPTMGDIITLSQTKDFTDTFEAAKKGIAKGYKHFYIYCGTGGRFDHTFANIQLLSFLAINNKRGYLMGQDCVTTVISNSNISFDAGCQGYISVFSYSDTAAGVSIKGLKYELINHSLTSTLPIGVSNEFTGIESTISVECGNLVIIFPRGCMNGLRLGPG